MGNGMFMSFVAFIGMPSRSVGDAGQHGRTAWDYRMAGQHGRTAWEDSMGGQRCCRRGRMAWEDGMGLSHGRTAWEDFALLAWEGG